MKVQSDQFNYFFHYNFITMFCLKVKLDELLKVVELYLLFIMSGILSCKVIKVSIFKITVY